MNYKNINLILVTIIMIFLIIIINTFNIHETFTDNHWMHSTNWLRLRPDDHQIKETSSRLSGARVKCPYKFSQVKDTESDILDISEEDTRIDRLQDTKRDTLLGKQFLQNYKGNINYKYSYYDFSHDPKSLLEYQYDEFNLDMKNEFTIKYMKYLFSRITTNQLKYNNYEVIKLNTLAHNSNNYNKIREELLILINKKILDNSYKDLGFFNENKNKILLTTDDNIREFQVNNKNKENIFNTVFKSSKFNKSDHKLLEFNILKELIQEEEEELNNNNLENYNFIMRIHRNNKNHHFFIFCNSVINTENNNIDFLILNIAGVLSEDNLIFKEMKEKKFNLTNNMDNKPYCKLDLNKNCNFKVIN